MSPLQAGREESVPSRDTGGAAGGRRAGEDGAGVQRGGMNDRAPMGTGKSGGKQKVVWLLSSPGAVA